VAEEPLGRHVDDTYEAGLQTVLEKRFLRVLTSSNSFDYYIFQGRRAGYQYEMVRAFTEHLNREYRKTKREVPIQFELLPVPSDRLIPMLQAGYADMIAARLTITQDRAEEVLFSRPYRRVHERIVRHRDAPPVPTRDDLAGRAVAVRRSSSYYDSLVAESERLKAAGREPIRIVQVDPALETEDILALVAEHHFDYTVADSMIARTAVEIHPELRLVEGVSLRKDGRLAWAAPPGARALVDEMNEFLERYRHGSLLGNVAVKRYFRDHGSLRRRLDDGSPDGLSRYDALFRRFGQRYGFDWRLLAAVAYQESRFDQKARNRWGATGLFQLKPETAREPYVDIPEIAGEENAANNVHAGARYLKWIKQRYFDGVDGMRERDRIRMALAAYNAGPRTLINARRRAKKMGLDPTRWFRNVELALLAMNKAEPVAYVSEINQRYVSYLMLGIE
jgi:membrane-bound lytic murein transglycosylase MltF